MTGRQALDRRRDRRRFLGILTLGGAAAQFLVVALAKVRVGPTLDGSEAWAHLGIGAILGASGVAVVLGMRLPCPWCAADLSASIGPGPIRLPHCPSCAALLDKPISEPAAVRPTGRNPQIVPWEDELG